ncbi:hypothetical protein P692DRAFT_20919425 [Suillus brevipes Sb2]|nr:hypothetical protein P692DRAFT_20919425 [Suillus brevipes Sb2]
MQPFIIACDQSESQDPFEILWWEVSTNFCSIFHGVDGAIPCNIAQEFLGIGILSRSHPIRCGVFLPSEFPG